MNNSPSLPFPSRSAIVLIALLQGLMLYAVQEASAHWPFNDFGNRLCWYSWVLTVPTAVALTLVELRDRRLWLHAVLASLVVLGLARWIGWNLGGEAANLQQAPLLMPFSLGMAIAVFVSLPWWQFRLQHGDWRASYDALFERAWQNGLTLALAIAFTALTWLLLWLWAALFQLVDIHFFRDLFRENAFIALATGSLFGFGILIGRTQHRAIQVTRQVLFAMCRGLLPLLAFIAVIFVLSLPFTGLEPLWRTRSAASLLLVLALLLVVFSNAVYQHDDDRAPYPRWLRRLVEASLLALPVYAGLALYAMGLRIAQYGWTPERFWGLLVALLVAGYALGYAVAVLRPRTRWLQRIEPVNRWMCWTVLGMALLANSPLIDPVRISVHSQVARLQAQAPKIEAEDARMLRFELGRRGYRALRALRDAPRFRADPVARAVIEEALSRQSRWSSERGPSVVPAVRDVAALRQQLLVAGSSAAPDAGWWQAVLAGDVSAAQCLRRGHPCVALRRDLDGDGQDEMLLCDLVETLGTRCQMHVLEQQQWRDGGSIAFWSDRDRSTASIHTALRQGKLEIQRQRWPRLSLDGHTPRDLEPATETEKERP